MRTSVVAREDLATIFDWLVAAGYEVVGPTERNGAIVYDELDGLDALPVGRTDTQSPGAYRLGDRPDGALFGYAVPADSWKRYLVPPRVEVLRIRRVDGSMAFEPPPDSARRYAFVGVRACEIAAMTIQDRVYLTSGEVEQNYADARAAAFVMAVNCAAPSESCFCVSAGSGPSCVSGFDLALTELISATQHEFLLESGSERGEEAMQSVVGRDATERDLSAKRALLDAAAASQSRRIAAADLHARLPEQRASPHWSQVAERCLACGSCTLVCPTCFCGTLEDSVDFDGTTARRIRRWDSCFDLEFSAVHGNPVRASTAARYRQWMTHKLSTWHEQFGTSGCVGCGRCITWCPVGIDFTREAARFAEVEAS